MLLHTALVGIFVDGDVNHGFTKLGFWISGLSGIMILDHIGAFKRKTKNANLPPL